MKNKEKIDKYINDNNITALTEELLNALRTETIEYILKNGKIDIYNPAPGQDNLMLQAVSGINNSLALALFDFGFDMKNLKKEEQLKIVLHDDLWKYGSDDLIKKILSTITDDMLTPPVRGKRKSSIIGCALSAPIFQKYQMVLEEMIRRKIDLKIDFLNLKNKKCSYSLFSYLIVNRKLELIPSFIESLSNDTYYLLEEVQKLEKNDPQADIEILKSVTEMIEQKQITNQKELLEQNIMNSPQSNYIVKL